MLVQIMNAQAVNKESVILPFSQMKFEIANILKTGGYLAGAEKKKRKTKKSEHELISLTLKYNEYGPVISGVKILSRPSRRLYMKASQIKPVRYGHGMSIISTSKGVMDSREAKKQNLGGEILFEVW